jgi:RHS repeat-associated protein
MALVNAISGAASAQYDYGPFGEPLRSTGPMAKANALAFSTRFYDIESGALYYGSRYFKADSGRWLSRDPLAEAGGANIHAFSDNDPVNNVDPIGENANPAFVIDAIKHGSRTATHHLRIYLVLEAAAYGTALKGRPMTSQFLFHYLDASGTALTLTSDQVNQIRQEPGFAKDEELNINKILKSLTDGSVDYKGTIQHHTFDQDVSPVDLFSAFHEIDFKSSLKGCVTKSSTVNTFDGTLTTELHDNWNFSNPDPRYSQRRPFNTIPSLPSSIRSITEEEFRQLELNGYVKAFDVDGKKVESVSIKAYGSTSVVSVKPSSTY